MAEPDCIRDIEVELDFGSPLRLVRPLQVLVATNHDEVRPLLRDVQAHAAHGRWCAGFLRYEAAAAFDPALAVHAADAPLAWFGLFEEPAAAAPPTEPPAPADVRWRLPLERAAFDATLAHVHRVIADGACYQVNVTSMLDGQWCGGTPRALYAALRRTQPRAWAAWIDTGTERVLSVSPELFFDWSDAAPDGSRVLRTQPMKGTAARGATPEQDRQAAQALRDSPKERAENLMIVDLLRNDLSRVALPRSVRVPRLFQVQALPTVWQMTSDVQARTRGGTTLEQVFEALFPCGSVTGAPKVEAMRQIRRLEPQPRGVYCGAIGVVRPGGSATFSVAIRTIEQRAGGWHCGIGSALTADSTAQGEWQEWRHKRAFLERASRPCALLETLRLQDGHAPAWPDHRQRMLDSARRLLGAPAAALSALAARLDAEVAACAQAHRAGTWRLRLTAQPAATQGGPPPWQVQLSCEPLAPTSARLRVRLADHALQVDCDDFLLHKTTRREHYDHHAPQDPAIFDTLLWNERGELTEFTRGNLALRLDGRWLTPALACGLLPGIARQALLDSGRLTEAVILREALARAQAVVFLNSLRGWLPVRVVGLHDRPL
ncbi:MAG: aminodeoxychorismate synthase component I [Aquabacterium sp.]|nr:aminodeoxychorismate synthase component I [Aquabacterium sp.]